LDNFIGSFSCKPRVAHVRHLFGQVEQRLLAVIELWRQCFLLRVIQSQSLPNIIKAPAHSQRRRGQNHAIELFEQLFEQQLAHINRRRRQKHALVPPFEPINKIPFIRFEQERHLLPQFEPPARKPQQLFRLLRRCCKLRLQSLQRLRQFVIRLAVLLQKRGPLRSRKRKSSFSRGKRFKKRSAPFTDSLRSPQQRWRRQMQQPQRDVRIPRQLLKPEIRNLPPEVIAGYIFYLVRFVKNHRRILRQNAPKIVLFQR